MRLETSDAGSLRDRLPRAVYVSTVLVGGLIPWLAPRPAMGDLPEHAAQVALLRDLLAGTSPWSELVRVNYFTPYLLGYALALALSFIVPVVAALKISLTLAYYVFVWACAAVRASLRGDRRLDWLFLPGFFGFAFQYGFYPFLLAAPIGVLFMLLAARFAARPTRAGALALVLAGIALFFSHGLVFLFACAVGVGLVLVGRARVAIKLILLAPYAALGLLGAVHFLQVRWNDPMYSAAPTMRGVEWDWFAPAGWHRTFDFLLYSFASGGKDGAFLLMGCIMLAAPWLLRLRPDRRQPAPAIPFLVVAAVWFLAPARVLETTYFYQRFAIFLLPAYAWAFPSAEGVPSPSSPAEAPDRGSRSLPVAIALVIVCWSFLSVVAVRQRRFATESAPFEALLRETEPGQRALGMVYSPASSVVRNPYTFHAYPVWYEVEKKGFVDFNFAYFSPEMVRFRPDRFPSIPPGFDETPETFDWQNLQAKNYRYFFVRHEADLPKRFLENDECRVALVKEVREWSLFQRLECR
jgi:hypothetical protein